MTATGEAPPRPLWMQSTSTPTKLAKPDSIMLYGLPGTRKTSIAASIALVEGFDKVLIVDVDQGTKVLAHKDVPQAMRDIDVLEINPMWPDAKDRLDKVMRDLSEMNLGYDAVILDTLDVAQDVAEKHFSETNPDPRDGFYVYRKLGEWTDSLVRTLHAAKHFTGIVTCHSTEGKTKSGAIQTKPRLSGATKDSIGGIPDIVAYLEYGNHPQTGEQHLLGTFGSTEGLITKERYRFPPQIVDPDMPKIYHYINESIGIPAAAA